MADHSDDLPVLVVDGARFSDLDGFAREFSRLLCHYTWRGNLDAFNDVLRGGFGTPENGWVFRWLNSESSRSALGYEATTRWLEGNLLTCHPSNRAAVKAGIDSARRGEGPTLFDVIVDIIRHHGPGGDESEDNVFLELL
ncbi:barstar family protein [Saccharothrix isguenensis]